MELKKDAQKSDVVRISSEEENKEVGHVYLYFIKNDGHDAPYAYIEDLFVEEEYRGRGIGGKMVEECIRFAQKKTMLQNNCNQSL
ncbi:MAG: GNAT family N-acetyltransferase [Candidatus Magasanikbacteria bacterium]